MILQHHRVIVCGESNQVFRSVFGGTLQQILREEKIDQIRFLGSQAPGCKSINHLEPQINGMLLGGCKSINHLGPQINGMLLGGCKSINHLGPQINGMLLGGCL
jgi:hypothetical protein